MTKQIDRYRASWHPLNNVGSIDLHYTDGNHETLQFNASNAIEFSVILQLLQGAEKPFVTSSGWISTGADDPG